MEGNEIKTDAELIAQAEELINTKQYYDAQQILKAVQTRDAYWNYLSGKLYYGMKWTSQARKYFKLAVEAEPDSSEYKNALDEIEKIAALEEERITKGDSQLGKSTLDGESCWRCLSCSC